MDFKDIIAEDITDVFLDLSEFAGTHIINGKEMTVVIDDNSFDGTVKFKFHGQQERRNTGGLFAGDIALYVSCEDTRKPLPSSAMELDGKQYRVVTVSEQDGIYKIILERMGGR